jgi:hypothetical protein
MKKTIRLKEICGEYCTKRNNTGIDELKSELERAVSEKEILVFDRSDVKILGVSFIDELFCRIMLDNNIRNIDEIAEFVPPLEEMHLRQIERGIRLRSS